MATLSNEMLLHARRCERVGLGFRPYLESREQQVLLLGVGTVGRIPYPNPEVTLFIRDRLKALKAVQKFEHSLRATPCRKLERGHRPSTELGGR